MNRMMVSCYKGLAPVSFPADWIEGIDYEHSFAAAGGRAQIRFPNGKAFEVWVTSPPDFGKVERHVRRLSDEEIARIPWGPFCPPWESYQTAKLFGHAAPIELDKVD